MKKRLWILALLTLTISTSALLFASCGSSESKPASSSESSQEQKGDFTQGEIELPEVDRP